MKRTQGPHPDLAYWEPSWLLAGLCTCHFLFEKRRWRKGAQPRLGVLLGVVPMGPQPWDLGSHPGSRTAKHGQRSSFLPCLLLIIQEFKQVPFWLQIIQSVFFHCSAKILQRCAKYCMCNNSHEKDLCGFLFSGRMIQPLEINSHVKLGWP